MHDYWLSLLLGVVEGLTEFLPVSSTAHLRLCEHFFQGYSVLPDSYWKMYTVVIQLGAILALPLYFRSRISKFLSTFPHGEHNDRSALTHSLTLVLIAFVCTAIPSLLLTKVIGKHLESLYVMGISLVVGGVIMWIVDAMFGPAPAGGRHKTEQMEEVSPLQAIWIGLCQNFSAVFPGTSRSMSTITAGQLAGMSRPSALEFSFFLSMPTMAAATLYDLYKNLHAHGSATALGTMPADSHQWMVLVVGFVVSFIVALIVVAWFMNWVRRRGFTPFAIYRIIAGAAVLFWLAR